MRYLAVRVQLNDPDAQGIVLARGSTIDSAQSGAVFAFNMQMREVCKEWDPEVEGLPIQADNWHELCEFLGNHEETICIVDVS
jgi:pantothenate kinase type III